MTAPPPYTPTPLEERVKAASEALAGRIADREDAKKAGNTMAVQAADVKVASGISDLATATTPLNAKAGEKLQAEAQQYQNASEARKDKIVNRLLQHLVAPIIAKVLIGTALAAALASVSTWAIIELSDTQTILDQFGNPMGDGHVIENNDGTADVYADTNGDGIMDTHWDNAAPTGDGGYNLANAPKEVTPDGGCYLCDLCCSCCC